MELLAAIDLRDGVAVRLVQGDFAQRHDYGDAATLAQGFVDGGARWLHVVDLDAARTGQPTNRATVVALAASAAARGVRVETGGGVRSERDVDELLDAGLARVVLGTIALEDPDLARRCARGHPGKVALGVDCRRRGDGTLEPVVRGWLEGTGTSLIEVLEGFAGEPFGAVVVTAIERDGTLEGPDVDGLGEVLDATELPVIASGGVGSVADVRDLRDLRSPRHGRALGGAIVGKALADGRVTIEEVVAACAVSE